MTENPDRTLQTIKTEFYDSKLKIPDNFLLIKLEISG